MRYIKSFLLICICFSALVSTTVAQEQNQKPNVVLIIGDDQAWNDFGFTGHEHIKTPNLDRLAKQSVTFTRGYVPTSLCRPSLASIVTGLYPSQHHISGNDPAIPAGLTGNARSDDDYMNTCEQLIAKIEQVPTLPRLLKQHGYKSMQTGKWWEGNYSRGGFDSGMTHGDAKRGGRHGDQGLKIGRQGLEPIFEFIQDNKDDPFFVWYAPFLPHTPHNPPQRLLEKYTVDGRPPALAKYFAMCEWFDETCGQLLDFLDQQQLAKNTVVIFVNDNGWIQRTANSAVPQGWRRSFAPKSKQSPYDGGLRTPIMIRWPGQLQPRIDNTTPVSSIDIAPTILAACGANKTDRMTGLSLLDGGAQAKKRNAVYGEIFAHDIANIDDPNESLLYRWVVEGEFKFIQPNEGKIGRYKTVHGNLARPAELYNLTQDPFETKQLNNDQVKSQLQNKMTTFFSQLK